MEKDKDLVFEVFKLTISELEELLHTAKQGNGEDILRFALIGNHLLVTQADLEQSKTYELMHKTFK